MEKTLSKQYEEESSYGYAYHHILLDDKGQPYDFEILEANQAFCDIAGVDNAAGKRMSDAFPRIGAEPYNWVRALGQVALQGVTLETSRKIEALDRELLVKAYSPRKDYFVTLISPAAKENAALTPEQAALDCVFCVASDLLCMVDPEKKQVYANERWRELLSWKDGDLTKESILDAIHPQDRESASAALAGLCEGRQFCGICLRCKNHEDGRYREIVWNGATDGKRLFVCGRDVAAGAFKEDETNTLLEYAGLLLDMSGERINYNKMADAARKLSGAEASLICLYDGQQDGNAAVVGVSGDSHKCRMAARLAERHFSQMKERCAAFSQICTVGESGWMEVSSLQQQETFPIASFFPIVREERNLGSLALFFEDTATIFNEKTVCLWAQMAGQLLYRTSVEQLLKNSLSLLEQAHIKTGVGFWEWDHASGIVSLGEGFFKVAGLFIGRAEVSYREFLEKIHPEDRKRVFLEDLEHQKNGEPYETMFRIFDDEGKVRWIRESGRTMLDNCGVAVRSVGSISDITDLKGAEEIARGLLEENQIIINGVQGVLFLLRVEGEGKYKLIRCNESFMKVTGITQELLEKGLFEQRWRDLYKSEYFLRFSACIASGVPMTYEQTLALPSGNKTWQVTLTPVFEGDSVKYIVGSSEDVSKRKSAERSLREHVSFNEKLVELMAMQDMPPRDYLSSVLNFTLDFTRSDRGFVLLWEEEQGAPSMCVCSNDDGVLSASGRLLIQCGILDEVVGTKKPLMLNCPRKYVFEADGSGQEAEIRRMFIVPVVEDGSLVAVAGVADKQTDYNADDNMRLQLLMKNMWTRVQQEQTGDLLRKEKELLKAMLHSIDDGIFATDDSGRIIMMNEQAEKMTGWCMKEAVGQPFSDVFHVLREGTRKPFVYPLDMVLRFGRTVTMNQDAVLLSADGKEYAIAESASPIFAVDGTVSGAVVAFRDVTLEKQKLKDIEFLNYHDSLTGLYNRVYFERELQRLDTMSNLPMSIVMADVNGLKLTNDAFGHAFGDELLKAAANVMRSCCRQNDVIARVGGDEFVLLLPNTDEQSAGGVVARISAYCAKQQVGSVALSISFGWETKSSPEEELAAVQKKAEDRMYRRKLFDSPSMRGRTITAITRTLHETHEREELHSRRVSSICEVMAKEIGMEERDIKELMTAGLLHDIGKIAIDGYILNKLGPLNEDEWRDIRRHPEIGYRILGSVNDLSDIANCVLAHHERWDGTGYPQRLKGEEIPLQARIIALADSFDAMISERPYGRVRSQEEAVEELRKNAGTQFDPRLVDTFVRLFEKGMIVV